eukprot:scaffold9435_cov137-Cylindrotheca_fusiformis.AAC.5
MRTSVLVILLVNLLNYHHHTSSVLGWSPSASFSSSRQSSPSSARTMSPTDFIDVEVTGHAKNPTKRKRQKKDDDEVKQRTKEIIMPAISPTMTKGKIVEWLVRTGDTIRKGDPIMVIESEKEVQGARGYRMNQDVNANVDGVLAAIYQQPGQAVDVGSVLGVIVPDYIIDAEFDRSNNSSQHSTSTADTKGTATSQQDDLIDPVVGTEQASETTTTATNSPPPHSLIDEIMPPPVTEAAKSEPPYNPDWVHGHHAETAGMVNDHSFYTAHTMQPGNGIGSVMPPPPNGAFGSAFTGSIDNSDAFYAPYNPEGNPHPPPQPSSSSSQQRRTQPPPPMNPNGATRDPFYDAYRAMNDPYASSSAATMTPEPGVAAEWHQQQPNNGMGAYYQAERNGQSPMEPTGVVGPPPVNGNRPPPPGPGGSFGGSSPPPPSDVFVSGQVSMPSTNDMMETKEEDEDVETVPKPQPMTQQATASFGHGVPETQKTDTEIQSQTETMTPLEIPLPTATSTTTTGDLAQVAAAEMEARISTLEQSLYTSGQDSVAFAAKVEDELASLRGSLSDLKRDYDEQVKKLEDSYQASLEEVGRDFSGTVDELRDWDSITVTWGIQDFEKTLRKDLTTYTSEEFSVAGYSMTLEMQIFGTNDDGSRDVGFYIMHTGGLNFVPIMIGGSKITIESSNGDNDAVKLFVDDASIEDSHYGWGWKKFFSLKDLKESYINSKGEIQVTATVRVKRVRSCRLNTAI